MATVKGVMVKLHAAKLQAETEERERIGATAEHMRIQAELEVLIRRKQEIKESKKGKET
jgi:hypothetical protein